MNLPAMRVVVESPLSDSNGHAVATNRQYARAAMRDCFRRQEAPFASHLLYAQPGILDDLRPDERDFGMACGFLWGACADLVAVYTDLGVTAGMALGVERAEARGIRVEYRTIAPGSW